MIKAPIDIHVQVYEKVFISLGWMPIMYFIRNCQIVFQSGCNILHSNKQCMKDVVFPHLWSFCCYYFILALLKVYSVIRLQFNLQTLSANVTDTLFVCLINNSIFSSFKYSVHPFFVFLYLDFFLILGFNF